jgi:hypothetical protein
MFPDMLAEISRLGLGNRRKSSEQAVRMFREGREVSVDIMIIECLQTGGF